MASLPFAALPITSNFGSALMISLTLRRKKLESSTTNTLIAMTIFPFLIVISATVSHGAICWRVSRLTYDLRSVLAG